MKKTIGGDRLGSGARMQVDLHGYERSTHDLGYIWRSTMAAGTLVPFMCEVALPGDTFDINLNCDIKTHPTIGPLFGSYKVQLDVFQAPIRLYQALLHNNKLGIGMNMANVKLPQIQLDAYYLGLGQPEDIDNCQINPSCLLSYLGIRGVGNTQVDTQRDFNAVPLLAYWEIYKNYYANKQEELGAVIHTPYTGLVNTVDAIEINGTIINQNSTMNRTFCYPETTIQIIWDSGATPKPEQIIINTAEHGDIPASDLFRNYSNQTQPVQALLGIFAFEKWGTTTINYWRYIDKKDPSYFEPIVQTFPLENIDTMRETILKQGSTPFVISGLQPDIAADYTKYTPYVYLIQKPNFRPNILNTQEGLGIKTYQSDLFNNWMQTEMIDGTNGINAITAIDTSGGSFTLDTLNLSKKVYDMLNRIAVSGGTYDDWLDAVYTHDRYKRAESPMYMGGLIKELVFQEVVSNAQSSEQPLGTLAGKGVMGKKHKGGNIVIKVDEPSYIMGIISLTPRLDYSQGNKWDVNLKTMDDLHKPALDEIGFQELITEQLAWWDTTYNSSTQKWEQRSAGKQPAWINYMTNVNQVRGNFAIPNNEMFMTLNRRYEAVDGTIGDLTTYIDPSKFNHIFADTQRDAQNFWAQIAVDITARRKMSAKVMPNL